MDPHRDEGDELANLRAAIAAGEGRFHNVIEKCADGVLVVSPEGAIRYANPAAVRLLERPGEQLHGTSFGVPIVPGETTEIDLPLASGEVRCAEMCVAETEWEGEPALLATLRDVSERKALEAQLRQKVEELHEADRRKDEFLAMLAHELRNPLAPIRNAIHIMKVRPGDAGLVDRMRAMIEQEVRSLTRLVDDLLDVSRIKTGKIRLRRETVNLSALVDKAVEAARPLMEAKGHVVRCSPAAPSIPIFADPVRIEQILVNLLTNAAKYTDGAGVVDVRTSLEGGDVSVSIRDTGMGIAPEILPRIFDLYHQADHAPDRAHGGLGIGLTLAHRLARLHGGDLTGRSEGLGKGSEFVLRLPLAPAPPATAPAEPPAGARPAGRRRRVLIVDDNRAMAESLAEIVAIWGHECQIVHDGPEAVRRNRLFRPDAILLDIGLPGMDGFAVAQEIRKDREAPRPELIAMSGYGRGQDRARAARIGIDQYLVKPVDLTLLQRLLDGAPQAAPG